MQCIHRYYACVLESTYLHSIISIEFLQNTQNCIVCAGLLNIAIQCMQPHTFTHIVDIIHVHCTLYTWILYILKFYLQPFLKVLFMQTYYTYIYYILPVLSYSFTKGVWPFFIIYIWLCMLGCIYCLCMVIKVQYPHLHTFTRMVVFYTCQECTLTICTHSICIFKTMYTVHDIYHSTQSVMNIYVFTQLYLHLYNKNNW